MSKFQMLRLLVALPKVSRLTACQFCASNHMETNVRRQSVFERYVEFQRQNKVTLNYGKVIDEGGEANNKLESSPTVEEIEHSDKIDELGHSKSLEKNRESLIVNETVSNELKTKNQIKDDHLEDQVNISENNKSHNVTKPNKTVQYKDENSKTLKSKVKLNSVSNQEITEPVVDRVTTTVKSHVKPSKKEYINKDQSKLNKIHIPDPNSPLRYILNCDLMPDVKSAMKQEDYLLFHEHLEKTQMSKLPSVSRIVKQVDSDKNQYLTKWKENKVQHIGEDGFKALTKAKTKSGVQFHDTIHRYLSGEKSIEISPDIQGYWNSIIHVLESFQEDDIKMSERMVSHPLLHYSGVFDCIAVYRNTLCIIDWKISEVPKPFLSTTYTYPHRVAAYLGAVNASFDIKEELGPVTNAVIVIAYPTGQPAHVHYLNDRMVAGYWNQWLEMLYSYWSDPIVEESN